MTRQCPWRIASLCWLLQALVLAPGVPAQELVATVPVGTAPGRPGVDTERNLVYVPNLSDGTVSVLDGETGAVIETLPPPGAPYAFATPVTVAVAHAASKIYVANAGGDDVVILDRLTHAHVATVPSGASPADVGVNEVAGKVYVANANSGDVTVLDAVTDAILTTVVLDTDARPREIDIDETTGIIYVACGEILPNGTRTYDTIQEISGDVYTGRKIDFIDPHDVQIDEATSTLYTVSAPIFGDSILYAIDATAMSLVGSTTWSVGGFANNFEFDPETNHFFFPALNDQYVTVFEIDTERRVSLRTPPNASPLRIAYNPVTKRVYAANRGGGTVSIVDDRRFHPENSKCWKVKDLKTPKFEKITKPGLSIHDDFVADDDITVVKPFLVCNPASVEGAPARDPDAYQCCYKVRGKKVDPKPEFEIRDAFGTYQWQSMGAPQLLCQPCEVTPAPQ